MSSNGKSMGKLELGRLEKILFPTFNAVAIAMLLHPTTDTQANKSSINSEVEISNDLPI